MSVAVVLNPSQSSSVTPGGTGWTESTGPTAGNVWSTAIGSFAAFQYPASIPQVAFTGVALDDYLYVAGNSHGLGYGPTVTLSGFNWPQSFTATGGSPPGVTIASVTSTTITATTSPATAGFATSGYLVVAQNNTTYVFSYSSIAGNVFNLSNGGTGTGNSLSYGLSWSGSAVSASTMSAGSGVTQYYLPIALSGTPSTTLPTATNPTGNGFMSTGYVMVIHAPSATANSSTYVYQYTGTSSTGFTGITATSLGSTGTSLPITSLSSGDVCVQFENPSGMYCTQLNAILRLGQLTNNYTQISLQVTLSSSTGLFPTQTISLSSAQIASLGTSTPGATTSVAVQPIVLTTPFALTPANLATISLTLGTTGPSQPPPFLMELRIAAAQIQFNCITNPPNVTVQCPQITSVSAGVGSINTLAPTIQWLYSDPDGLAQASYRVVVFGPDSIGTFGPASSYFNVNNPGVWNGTGYNEPTPSGYSVWAGPGYGIEPFFKPVFDSGDVAGTATSMQLTWANCLLPSFFGGGIGSVLQNGQTYRVFVYVTAIGTNGLYQTLTNSGTVTGQAGASNAGIDVMPIVEPILRPSISFPSTPGNPVASFNPTTGEIGPIAVRARQNLLTQNDADGLAPNAGVTPSIGGWTFNATYSAGTGTAPTLSAVTPSLPLHNAYTESLFQVAAYATTTTQIAFQSAMEPCSPGEILTATVKLLQQSSFTGSAAIYLQFYDINGANPIVVAPQLMVPTTYGSLAYSPTLVWTQAKAPTGAMPTGLLAVGYVQMIVVMKATLSGASNPWWFFEPMITNSCINLLDDAAIDSGQVYTAPGNAMVYNSGFQELGGTNNGTVVAPGPSNPGGVFAAQAYGKAANASSINTFYMIGSFAVDANKWLMAVDAQTATGVSAPDYSPANEGVNLGALSADGNQTFQNGSAITVTPTYTRFVGVLTPGGTTAGFFGVQIPAVAFTTGTALNATNFQLERVWTLTDGGFDTFTSGTTIPLATALGNYTSNTAANPGHWWQLLAGDTASSDAQISTGGQSGNCCVLQSDDHTVAIEQFFTVSGLTSITPTWYWKYSTGPGYAQAYIEFFDNAVVTLSVNQIPGTINTQAAPTTVTGTQASFVQVTPGAITVPPTAAFAHIVFSVVPPSKSGNPTTLYIDTVTMTLTGTLAPSTPWIDGGWSQGGLQGTAEVTLQRSPDDVNWTTLRVAPNAAQAQPVVGASLFEADYTDYEWPTVPYGTASQSSLYYRAFSGSSSSTLTSPSNVAPTLTVAGGFITTNWMLIDPLYGGNITLQVKGDVSFTTDENQTVLMPMSRGRKVVLGDTAIFGDTITLNLQTLTNADYVALQAMYSKVYPLVLRSPDGEMWYVRATKRSRKRTWQGSYTRPLRTYELNFETVDVIP